MTIDNKILIKKKATLLKKKTDLFYLANFIALRINNAKLIIRC